MDDDDDDDDDRSRRTNGRAPALPQILRQWATHHVGAFVEDADSSEHILSSDYDGNALGAEARRAIHEEARRRGVRAKSVDLANGTRAVALTRRANEDEDEDEDGDETATRRRKARRVDDSDDTAEDDREDEEDARARELVGYVDLRETPFDVHAELKISKDNSNPAGRARAAYHREAIKWHPDNATPTPSGTCRACGCVLQFKRWVRARSATDYVTIDACSTCFETARDARRRRRRRRRRSKRRGRVSRTGRGRARLRGVFGRSRGGEIDVRVQDGEWVHEGDVGVS